MGKLPSEEESIQLSSSERFQPREDDDQLLWEVTDIISEKRGFYKVRWKGDDPATGKPWAPSWVSKGDVTDDLVKSWKLAGKQTVVKETGTRQNVKCTCKTTPPRGPPSSFISFGSSAQLENARLQCLRPPHSGPVRHGGLYQWQRFLRRLQHLQ